MILESLSNAGPVFAQARFYQINGIIAAAVLKGAGEQKCGVGQGASGVWQEGGNWI